MPPDVSSAIFSFMTIFLKKGPGFLVVVQEVKEYHTTNKDTGLSFSWGVCVCARYEVSDLLFSLLPK